MTGIPKIAGSRHLKGGSFGAAPNQLHASQLGPSTLLLSSS
jgi:hypothetical protein